MAKNDDPLGYDLACRTGLTPTMLEDTGLPLMIGVIVRRLYTPNGSLLSCPNARTTDLRLYVSSTQDRGDTTISTIQQDATAALLDDARIFEVSVAVNWEPDASFMELNVSGVCAAGPFALTLKVDAVTVTVLQQ